jgi:hypothetical protein
LPSSATADEENEMERVDSYAMAMAARRARARAMGDMMAGATGRLRRMLRAGALALRLRGLRGALSDARS